MGLEEREAALARVGSAREMGQADGRIREGSASSHATRVEGGTSTGGEPQGRRGDGREKQLGLLHISRRRSGVKQ